MSNFDILHAIKKICHIHAGRIHLALEKTAHLWPMSVQQLHQLSDVDLSFLELLSNRFAKLQSYMGEQLFPHLLEQLQENIDSTSFLDRLHMLEKLKLISSADNWKLFRELRNHLAHEYPENPSLQCAYMNELHKTAQQLLGEWDSLSRFIDDKFAIQRPSL